MDRLDYEVLCDVSRKLNTAGIAFMVTGSVAMNYYAQPRMTRDIDLVVQLSEADGEKIIRLFEPEYYVSYRTLTQAIGRRSMFNLVHGETTIKVDFVVLKDTPYRQAEFRRRREIDIGTCQIWIVSCEDLILSKLVWAKDSKSEMQLKDVRNLLHVDHDQD